MKCDELQARTIYVDWKGGEISYYDPYEVNETIAELKHHLQLSEENVDRLNNKMRSKIGKVEELKAENESLRKAVINWHDKYCNLQETIDRLECKLECVKANKDKELRETKRALWRARSGIAHLEEKCFIHDMYDDNATAEESAKDEIMANKWYKVNLLCIKKAKEYK